MWEVQEKDALAKETADNIIADAETSAQWEYQSDKQAEGIDNCVPYFCNCKS